MLQSRTIAKDKVCPLPKVGAGEVICSVGSVPFFHVMAEAGFADHCRVWGRTHQEWARGREVSVYSASSCMNALVFLYCTYIGTEV